MYYTKHDHNHSQSKQPDDQDKILPNNFDAKYLHKKVMDKPDFFFQSCFLLHHLRGRMQNLLDTKFNF